MKNKERRGQMIERVKMVKAMEFIARQINNEEIFCDCWLSGGVADGDIEYGDLDLYSPLETDPAWFYVEDEGEFSELMETFLRSMSLAKKSGGLYCGGVVSK